MKFSRAKQCGSKRRFDSRFDARMGMIELVGNRPEFTVYFCRHCEFWHFGHNAAPVFVVPYGGKFDMRPGAINEIMCTRIA